ncbi:MAG: type II toxin-antitoxin system VapC family toxin [Terracidiphilus sp.]|jgi:ribonuclease VapC
MIVDSSALVAILMVEPEARRLTTAIAGSTVCRLPASCLVETSILMLSRRGEDGVRDFDLYLARSRMEIVPLTESQAGLARDAFRRFGKGRHPAKLNFGDCMAYAVAKETGDELLFKGDDFSQTDVVAALY